MGLGKGGQLQLSASTFLGISPCWCEWIDGTFQKVTLQGEGSWDELRYRKLTADA